MYPASVLQLSIHAFEKRVAKEAESRAVCTIRLLVGFKFPLSRLPSTEGGARRRGAYTQYDGVQRFMNRLYCSILAVFALTGAPGKAQTLRVRLLNGRSGKPIANTYVNVWVGDQRKDAVPVSINSNGDGTLSLTNSETDALVQAGSSHPTIFPYAPEVRLQVGFALCQSKRQTYSWLQITPYSTDEWTRTGIVTANTCGKAVANPEPGLLTIFVRPLTFWERLSE